MDQEQDKEGIAMKKIKIAEHEVVCCDADGCGKEIDWGYGNPEDAKCMKCGKDICFKHRAQISAPQYGVRGFICVSHLGKVEDGALYGKPGCTWRPCK